MSKISEGFCRLADSLIEVFVIVKSFLKYFIYYSITSDQFAGGGNHKTFIKRITNIKISKRQCSISEPTGQKGAGGQEIDLSIFKPSYERSRHHESIEQHRRHPPRDHATGVEQ